MENLDALVRRGLRAYELGRLRMAARVALVVLPLATICLLEPVGRGSCVCCTGLLLAGALWLRFRNRAGVDSVTTGLIAGGVPLAAVLLLSKIDPGCATAGTWSYCTVFSVFIGSSAGAIVALREAARPHRTGNWIGAAGVAVLAASLGCVRLGVASVVGVALGILLGRTMAQFARR